MAFYLTASLPGGDRVSVALDRYQQYLKDLRPFWREYVAPKFFDTVKRNFDLEGGMSEAAGGWAALSPAYAAAKARHYPGKPILQRTGHLYRSLQWLGESVGPEGVFEAHETWARLGTSVPYGIYHQFGGRRLPRRRVLFFPAGSNENYNRLLQQFVIDMRDKSGLGTMAGKNAYARFL